jgi:hypothetical protein
MGTNRYFKSDGKEFMNSSLLELRASLSRPQAEILKAKLSALPFDVKYRLEPRGSALTAVIRCELSQEKTVREILHDITMTASIDIYAPPPEIVL